MVLASIRPLLEARGIEMAAKKAKGYAKMAQEEIDRRKLSSGDAFGWCAAASSLAIILEAYAQRHAEGGKWTVARKKIKSEAEKRSARGRRSNVKGGAFERDTGRRLSLWLTHGERKDLFSRNVLSGGRFTIQAGQGDFKGNPGDLVFQDPISYDFMKGRMIECKHYGSLGWDAFLYGSSKCFLALTLAKLMDDAAKAEKKPGGWSPSRPSSLRYLSCLFRKD